MAVWGFHCCMHKFSLIAEGGGSSLVAVHWLLIAVVSLVAEHRALERMGFYSCSSLVTWHVGSFRTRGQTSVPYISRQVLNHWAKW